MGESVSFIAIPLTELQAAEQHPVLTVLYHEMAKLGYKVGVNTAWKDNSIHIKPQHNTRANIAVNCSGVMMMVRRGVLVAWTDSDTKYVAKIADPQLLNKAIVTVLQEAGAPFTEGSPWWPKENDNVA